ncbi:MAG: hypothetical protein COB93_04330 [Sneathiella sp.]|nr:MAG: hypothetical protein COB93_04330 [Sneathiella sp.]
MTDGAIDLILLGKPRDIGGFDVRRLLPQAKRRAVGPFVFLDHMGPTVIPAGSGMDVKPHPHIGLATVTYLYEGAILHRDSVGSVQEISPGDVNLMTAGCGITHSERSSDAARATDQAVNGLQMWVALPAEDEEMAPAFSHTPKALLPLVSGAGWRGRVVVGELFGETSPVVTRNRLFFGDLQLQAGAELAFTPAYDEAAVYVVSGSVKIDGERVEEGSLAILKDREGGLITASGNTVIAVLGGDSLPEPRHMYWNFVSTRKQRLEQAKDDWQQQAFDKVPGDSEFTLLPEHP